MRWKGWLVFLVIVVVVNVVLAVFADRWRFDTLVIHHSASDVDNYESIRAFHLRKGWTDAAYHLLLSNGSTDVPFGELEATTRFEDLTPAAATRNRLANARGLHLCLVGNYEKHPLDPALRPALAHAILALCETFSIVPERVIFHRDVNNTACPGKHLTKDDLAAWLRDEAAACPAEIAEQQDAVIALAGISTGSYPRALLMLQAGITLLLLLVRLVQIRYTSDGSSGRRGGSRNRGAVRRPVYRSAADRGSKRNRVRSNRHR